MRPDRSPVVQQWIYDLGFLSFSGTMGVFLVGSLIWMTVTPPRQEPCLPDAVSATCNLCNALTEVSLHQPGSSTGAFSCGTVRSLGGSM